VLSQAWAPPRERLKPPRVPLLEVAIAGRRGGHRLWDLAARVYADDPVVPGREALRIRNERRPFGPLRPAPIK
jgi:hypothetical protein